MALQHPALINAICIPVPATASNTLIKSGPGRLFRVIPGCDFSASSPTFDFAAFIYDNLTASGTPIVSQRFTSLIPLHFDIDFQVGLVVRLVHMPNAFGSLTITYV